MLIEFDNLLFIAVFLAGLLTGGAISAAIYSHFESRRRKYEFRD